VAVRPEEEKVVLSRSLRLQARDEHVVVVLERHDDRLLERERRRQRRLDPDARSERDFLHAVWSLLRGGRLLRRGAPGGEHAHRRADRGGAGEAHRRTPSLAGASSGAWPATPDTGAVARREAAAIRRQAGDSAASSNRE